MKGIIIYKSKYGATRQYADWLCSLLHLPAVVDDDFTGKNLQDYDYFVIGSSVYIGKLLIRDWLRKNMEVIRNKKIFLFIVCGTRPENREQLDMIVRENLAPELRNACTIYFLPGRMNRSKLSRMDRFLLKMGAMLTKNPEDKKNMSRDYDAVKKENLAPFLNTVTTYAGNSAKNNLLSGVS